MILKINSTRGHTGSLLVAYYCGRRNMAEFTSRFPRLRIPFNPTVG